MRDFMREYIYNTTPFRIVTSVIVTAINIQAVMIGILVFKWEPTPTQVKVLIGIAATTLTMMGFDVLQFWSKRSTDAGLAAARSGTPGQTLITGSSPQVDVNATGGSPGVQVGSPTPGVGSGKLEPDA